MFFILLCLVLLPCRAASQDIIVPADSLVYHSDFHYTQSDLDSLIHHSPKLVLWTEQTRIKNKKESLLSSTTLHFNYNPIEEQFLDKKSTTFSIGFSISLSKLFYKTEKLERIERESLVIELKLHTRELMKDREILLEELQQDIQKYKTLMMDFQKTAVSLLVKQASSDDVMKSNDEIIQLLTGIKKKHLEIQFREDQLKAFIGKL